MLWVLIHLLDHFLRNLCQIGSGGWSASNCDLVFSDSGFDVDVPDKYAAEAVEVTISAVKQGDSNTKCDVGFGNVTKSVALWSQYLNPQLVILSVILKCLLIQLEPMLNLIPVSQERVILTWLLIVMAKPSLILIMTMQGSYNSMLNLLVLGMKVAWS